MAMDFKFEISDLKFVSLGRLSIKQSLTRFTGGATRDVNEREQFASSAAFKALGNAIRNGHAASLDLIAQAKADFKSRILSEVVNTMRQAHGFLPHREVVEALVGHARL